MTIGIIGIILGLKKIAGAPFFTVFSGFILFGLLVIVQNVEVDYVEAIDYTLGYPMNVTTGTTGLSFSTTIFGIAERPANTQSVLVDKNISCIIVDMDKEGAPVGTVTIGILDNDNMMYRQFGTISASTINALQRGYTFCLPNHDYHQITLYDRIGVKYTSGTGTDTIRLFVDATNPFDGTNTVRTSYSGSWIDVSTGDMHMQLIDDQSNIIGEPVLHNFNKFETWAFMIVFSMFFIFIGLALQFQRWG